MYSAPILSLPLPYAVLYIMSMSTVVLDVYQKEHLLREEELKEAIEWEWHRILPSKDAATATRIGEILEKHGLKKEARELRG